MNGCRTISRYGLKVRFLYIRQFLTLMLASIVRTLCIMYNIDDINNGKMFLYKKLAINQDVQGNLHFFESQSKSGGRLSYLKTEPASNLLKEEGQGDIDKVYFNIHEIYSKLGRYYSIVEISYKVVLICTTEYIYVLSRNRDGIFYCARKINLQTDALKGYWHIGTLS